VALLYDKLQHPDGDLGLDSPSCINWNYDPLKEIDHIVIGKAPGPGGAWNDLDGSQLTISPSRWMELPDMSFASWQRQKKILADMNAGLVFSSLSDNFSEDNSLLNANTIRKPNNQNYYRQLSSEESRPSMHDVRNYYIDYVKQKNLDKYLLNNATVTSVRRVCCTKLICQQQQQKYNCNEDDTNCLPPSPSSSPNGTQNLWEVVGLIDKRDRKKASSLTHKGDLMEFRFLCKHLVLANGATDLHNELHVKGENNRFILRSIRELEDKIKEDSARLRKDPLLIIGSGLSAADAVLMAQKHRIKIIHVIRRSVTDPNLVFGKLPKTIYPEYQRVYEQMNNNRYTNLNKQSASSEKTSTSTTINKNSEELESLKRSNSQAKDNNKATTNIDYVLYDEYQIKSFTSKRTCILSKIKCKPSGAAGLIERSKSSSSLTGSNTNEPNNLTVNNTSRHLHLQKQLHQHHQRQLDECEEENELKDNSHSSTAANSPVIISNDDEIELKISYACILIGFSPDLDFLPNYIVNELAVAPIKLLNTKDNPISVNEFTHESRKFKNLFAMGPLIGDNFVRFGTGGALAITSAVWKYKRLEERQRLKQSASSSSLTSKTAERESQSLNLINSQLTQSLNAQLVAIK
jgi:hypothetical protein